MLLSTVYSSGNSNSYIYGYGGLAFISVFGVAVGLCLKILVDNFAIGRKFSCLSPLLGGLLMGYRWVRALWRVSAPQYSPNFWGLTWLGVVPVGVAACTALPVMTAKSTAVDSAAQIALNNYVIPVGNIS